MSGSYLGVRIIAGNSRFVVGNRHRIILDVEMTERLWLADTTLPQQQPNFDCNEVKGAKRG